MQRKALNAEIGNRIQRSREKVGLTQERFAEQIERSPQYVSMLERGLTGPSLEVVIAACRVLNVSADYILRGARATPATETIAEKLARLPEDKLNLADQIIDCMLALSGFNN